MPWSISFSVINAKGGVGKTTTAVNVAAMAVTLGKSDGSPLKALIIDIDHQTNATQQLGYHDLERDMTLAGHVIRDAELNRIIIHNACGIEGLDLIPSHFQLAYVDKGVLARGTWIRRMLREIIPQYDLIIFDCPADLGISFAVFIEECHGNIASSTIVDDTVKRSCWRILPWCLLSGHPLGCVSGAYLLAYSRRRPGKPSRCWRRGGPWPVGSARRARPLWGLRAPRR
jgi:Mrp family chromosome partitioning ATPase